MNAPSSNRVDVISIKRLDTAALRQLRAAVQAAPPIAPVSSKPVAATAVRSTPGRRTPVATFALGLLVGLFSSHLGEARSTPLPLPASPPVQPTETAAPTIATAVAPPSPTIDAPKPTTSLTEPSSPAKPPHRHHG